VSEDAVGDGIGKQWLIVFQHAAVCVVVDVNVAGRVRDHIIARAQGAGRGRRMGKEALIAIAREHVGLTEDQVGAGVAAAGNTSHSQRCIVFQHPVIGLVGDVNVV
jgi:hypothetical protein